MLQTVVLMKESTQKTMHETCSDDHRIMLEPIAYFHSPLTSKFGIPRQSGLASLPGQIVFEPSFRQDDAVRGLDGFDYLWIIWGFSANKPIGKGVVVCPEEEDTHQPSHLTVRPPRLGGNARVGVFASRSPFRPNGLGLSCVLINKVELHTSQGPVVHVLGADLMDGTPIYDLKPYVTYADSHPEARSGFVDSNKWKSLEVVMCDESAAHFTPLELDALKQILALDPRPQYHKDPHRIYGMPYAGKDVRFRVEDGKAYIIDVLL